MTYCVAVKLEEGLIFASDSRTHAGVDNYATFCKMTVFERANERVLVMLSSGGLAGTQAVISVLRQRIEAGVEHLFNAPTMFEVANRVADAMRHIDRRDTPHMGDTPFNASFILGGQIKGRPMQLFRIYAEGNFIEAGTETPFLQTGEAKYGKPIIDRVITPTTNLADGIKCLLISFDSTLRSNLSVGMPIDLLCYERDSLRANLRHRFEAGDAHFSAIREQWNAGTRRVFKDLPELRWSSQTPTVTAGPP
jgi:putative proteasome-type protease